MTTGKADLQLGRIVRSAFALFGRAPLATFGPAGLFFLVFYGLTELVTAVLGGVASAPDDANALVMGEASAAGVVVLYLNVLLYNVTGCAMLAAAYRADQGQPPAFAEAIALAAVRAPTVAVITAAEVLAFAAVDFIALFLIGNTGSLFFALPALGVMGFLAVQWWLVAPVAAAETLGMVETFRRAIDLVRGYRWQVLRILAVFFSAMMVAGILVGLVLFQLASGGAPEAMEGGGPSTAASVAIQAVIGLFVAAANAILGLAAAVGYFDIRAAKEGGPPDNGATAFS